MTVLQEWQITSSDVSMTEELGYQLGQRCHGGEIIELVSDLGGGKTTFVRGLAAGLGSTDTVASPSFTISREYRAGEKTLYHFDFYRLQEAGIMGNELAELIEDPQAVVVIEWADIVDAILPNEHLTIQLTAISETERILHYSFPEALAYLIREYT